MSWIKTKSFPLEQNLNELNRSLNLSQIHHRIAEENGQQVLWVHKETDMQTLEDIISESQYTITPTKEPEESNINNIKLPKSSSVQSILLEHPNILQQIKKFPATSFFIFFGIIGYVLIKFAPNADTTLIRLFFSPLLPVVQTGEVWRLLTPTFLHFGVLHILFNSLWMWEMGRRLENFLGFNTYLIVFLSIAIGANYIQFLISDHIFFGGLSGVVYGFLGLLLVLSRFYSHPTLTLPSGIYIFMIIWMFLGIFKVVDFFMANSVANGAHLGGFVIGIAIGGVIYLKNKAAKN